MIANIPGTCCDTNHNTGQKIQDSENTPRKTRPKVVVREGSNIDFTNPGIQLLAIPLSLFVIVFLVAEMFGIQEVLWALVASIPVTAFVVLVLCVWDVESIKSQCLRNALSEIPQPLLVKVLILVFTSLIVGFIVPFHNWLPTAEFKVVFVMVLVSYGLGAYYESLTNQFGSDFAPVVKWLSLAVAIALIVVGGIEYQWDIF